jgi:hypothetical protein
MHRNNDQGKKQFTTKFHFLPVGSSPFSCNASGWRRFTGWKDLLKGYIPTALISSAESKAKFMG